MTENLMDRVYAKAKANPKRVAFPEACDLKMLQAMVEVCEKRRVVCNYYGTAD